MRQKRNALLGDAQIIVMKFGLSSGLVEVSDTASPHSLDGKMVAGYGGGFLVHRIQANSFGEAVTMIVLRPRANPREALDWLETTLDRVQEIIRSRVEYPTPEHLQQQD